MTTWVLQRHGKRAGRTVYVAPAGSPRSYTADKAAAERFATREAAAAASCIESEFPVEL